MARFGPGTVVAITGGARGIGRATAAAFVAAGAHVAIGDLDAYGETAADLGPPAVGLPLDVTDRTSFRAFLDAAESELGPLDVLVNNAGIMPSGPFLDEDDAMTDRVLDVNLRGVLIGCKLAGRGSPRAAGGTS
jgi:NAD(P)-dependent dehydrogenase (short-subunit alcohol dehydrogenase family)